MAWGWKKNILVLFAAGAVSLGGLGAYSYHYYFAPGPVREPTTLLFKKGTGFQSIVDQMAEAGVIRHPLLFKAIAVAQGSARKFKAGEYEFSALISPRLIMDMIAEGHVVVHKITIPEGLTVRQIKQLLDSTPLLEGEFPATISEGGVLPQTYHYTYGDDRGEIAERMQKGMRDALAELWPTRKEGLPLQSPREALVLASIVEKETGVPDERGRVAAVFINRLKMGMKLQSDPTVIYGIELENGALGRPLTGSDLRHESPYNTYKIAGLPPAPIANPGREAIAAVLNPPDTDYLYFVATGTGGHNFSKTLDGHNANVREYRKVLASKKQEKK